LLLDNGRSSEAASWTEAVQAPRLGRLGCFGGASETLISCSATVYLFRDLSTTRKLAAVPLRPSWLLAAVTSPIDQPAFRPANIPVPLSALFTTQTFIRKAEIFQPVRNGRAAAPRIAGGALRARARASLLNVLLALQLQ